MIDTDTRSADPVLRVRNLSVSHQSGFTLLSDSEISLAPGEVVMLVGPSGAGKSTLINLLAGTVSPEIDGWQLSGMMDYGDQTFDLARDRVSIGGIIFQNFALFNELTVAENLKIVEDHNEPVSRDIRAAIDGLLAGINPSALISECSGGQRQRVAIARTLLANHPVLLMDEPNSGLDIVASERLGALIRRLAKEAGVSIVVIAHHFNELMSVADRTLLLDSGTNSLVEYPADAAEIERVLRDVVARAPQRGQTGGKPSSFWQWALTAHKKSGVRSRDRSSEPPIRIRWLLRYLFGYIWEHGFAPSSIMFITLGSLIIGFVTTWFVFQYLPFRDLLLPIIHSEALAGLAFTELRVLAPLVTAVLLVTRNSALIGSEVGHKVHSDQIRAMQNLRIPYRTYITYNILIASVVATVILVTLSVCVTAWVAMQTWAYIFPDDSTWLWRDQFFQRLRPSGVTLLVGVDWILIKAIPSVVGAMLLALWFGYQPKATTTEINLAIARSLIGGMSFVLIWHAVLILVEFKQVSARLEATF
jgi:ABC-type multidrug transport system ATPase subunit/ABC-type transporter Mla maintaining outer membrane lipid asymmetry permease subunit MlaE